MADDTARGAPRAGPAHRARTCFSHETAAPRARSSCRPRSSFEKDGTFMNAERRLQRVRKVIDTCGRGPLGRGDPRATWRRPWARARDSVRDRRARFGTKSGGVAGVRGATYERLERGGLQWPCPSEDHDGTARLYAEGFPAGASVSDRSTIARRRRQPAPSSPCCSRAAGRCISSTPGTMTVAHEEPGTPAGRRARPVRGGRRIAGGAQR